MPVSGTVLLDGEPVESAAVIFSSVEGGRPATGITDAQGRFRLRTFDGNDGVLPGEHQVAISKKDVSGSTSTPDGLAGPVDFAGLQVRFIIPSATATGRLRV